MDTLEQNYIEPHTYPLWIIIPSWGVLGILIYFFVEFPYYRSLHAQIKKAEHEFCLQNYYETIELYEQIFARLPDFEQARLRLAQAYFALGGFDNEKKAINYIKKGKLSENSRKELYHYVPKQRKNYS